MIRPMSRATPYPPAPKGHHAFAMEMLHVGRYHVRVGRQAGSGGGVPLLLFNGIGGNIELVEPLGRWMPGREIVTFDIPGVGHSAMPRRPYRLSGIARLAAGILDRYGHAQADVMGISWGGGAAQQFARSCPARCRRLILAATATGVVMVPSHPAVLWKRATPRRFISKHYARQIAGDIYGGDFRRDTELVGEALKHVRWQSRLGYYLQLAAIWGWTSVHWLHKIRQPTLVMAGADDPLVPLVNAKLMHALLPQAELRIFDCGHLFLLTRPLASARVIGEFLDRPTEAFGTAAQIEPTLDSAS
jgi:poly(3-hydroxyalkanoate) depolymerase